MQKTFHVVSLPHTQTSKKFVSCAYTQKVLNFCKMMKSLGHKVYHYGGEGSEVECDEHINIITNEERQQFWGGNDWTKEFYAIGRDANLPYWKLSNERAIEAMKSRVQERDFICIIGGNCQKPIADAFPAPGHITVEFGVGYEGVFSKYKVFESYAHMHYIYGKLAKPTGDFYDQVIPNYFDVDDFPFETEKEDYFLYIGRLITNKGVEIAVEMAKKAGVKLKLAGQGGVQLAPGKIQVDGGAIYEGDLEYVGTVNVEERGILMSKAKAVIAPTLYIEPFGGVVVEAQMCGTPVITTDRGAFTETVLHGKTGYRIRTLEQGVWAMKNIDKIDPKDCRYWATQNYSLEKVKHMYNEYFDQLYALRCDNGDGWYSPNEARTELDYLVKKQ